MNGNGNKDLILPSLSLHLKTHFGGHPLDKGRLALVLEPMNGLLGGTCIFVNRNRSLDEFWRNR